MAEGQSLEKLLRLLSSSTLDSSEEADVIEEAVENVKIDSGSKLSILDVPKCQSKDSCKRVADLYCEAISSCEDDEVLGRLCRGLCKLLSESGDGDLTKTCSEKMPKGKPAIESALLNESRSSSLIGPALTLGIAVSDERIKWIETFAECALLGKTFASNREINFCAGLLEGLTQEEWTFSLAAVVGRKLKANPEKAIETIHLVINGLVDIDVSSDLEGESQLLSTLTKQLKSPKAPLRTKSQEILVKLATLKTQSDATWKISVAVADALPTMLQPDQREGSYNALRSIATQLTTETYVKEEISSTVLSGITKGLGKETKAHVASREAGVAALFPWMVAAKRNGGGGEGYAEALAFLRKPLETGNGSETVQRLGPMFLATIIDVQESLVLDLCKGEKVETGLQKIVENATKKGTSVASVEGLVAIHTVLLYAVGSSKNELKSSLDKVLGAGSSSIEKSSFLYGKPLLDAIKSSPLVAHLLPRTIALYSKLLAKKECAVVLFPSSRESAASRALAICIAHPSNVEAALSSLQLILTYQKETDAVINSLLLYVNEMLLQSQEGAGAAKKTVKEQKAKSKILDPKLVRRAAMRLAQHTQSPKTLAKALLLMHLLTTLKVSGKPRTTLVGNALDLLNQTVVHWLKQDVETELLKDIAEMIDMYACGTNQAGGGLCDSLNKAALSLICTLGGIGCAFNPELDDPEDPELRANVFVRKLCTEELSSRFAGNLKSVLGKVEELSSEKMKLFNTPMGLPWKPESEEASDEVASGKVTNASKKRSGGKSRRGKGDFGSSFEDEEWERQMKKEIAQKKKKDEQSETSGLSSDDKKLVAVQDKERLEMKNMLNVQLPRVLSSIRMLCESDIEIGNSCLPALGQTVVLSAVIECEAFRQLPNLQQDCKEALTTMASCVYELDEDDSPLVCESLILCCRKSSAKSQESSTGSYIDVIPFPTQCEPPAHVIAEMDGFGDVLCGASFGFLFPIVKAALTGPRTTHGCEAALAVLERHTSLLVGEDKDPNIKLLRKDLAAAVLELLSHDRAQTFSNPAPSEALVSCYAIDGEGKGPGLTSAELSPLLDERGALGVKNCRIGAMIALESIATTHPKLIKNNPLVENRIWMNAFAVDQEIRDVARLAWRKAASGGGSDDMPPPSIMYSIPLLPLMSHTDSSICSAAASANAYAMGQHVSTTKKNLQKLCANYIGSYVVESSSAQQNASLPSFPAALPSKKPATAAPAPKKKPISTGLPKKKTTKKDALSVAGLGRPKSSGKKKTAPKKINPALLKPKEERTFDKEILENQFRVSDRANEGEKDSEEKIRVRGSMLSAISAITEKSSNVSIDIPTLKLVTTFLMAYGLADCNEDVRGQARDCLRDMVATFGSSDDAIAFLLPSIEGVLGSGSASAENLGDLSKGKIPKGVQSSDRRKQGAVVALGSVALHLKGAENEGKIDATIDMLISTLKTPSESVQASVADCLAKLMKKGKTQERVEQILTGLLRECMDGASSSHRRGAAYGISAAVKGSGIASLKKFEVVKKLEEASSGGSSNNKEGALFAMELLSARLGLLFEPYVIVLLPSLLKSFSDTSDHVRKAASDTAGSIMSKLSAHGVKLVMPAVLTAFNDPAWRTKQASIHMLGSMSHCAPKQLASALPKVVPKLTEAFADTHPKVKLSAEEALDEISKVVKNPEISSISSTLLKALTDPSEGTMKALEALIETEFLHAIDAPSLALIVPILHRGLRDRVATTKRYGALIAGNICTMINDPKDFIPYLPTLIPDLKTAILDPIPDVRSTSAKALGSLARGLGEENLPDLRSWLIGKLREAGVTSAERSGAAQGLTELFIAGGGTLVEDVMRSEILPLHSHPEAGTREGVLWILTFLPPSLGQSFTSLIDVSLPALIGGLSDESEPVRDVAMRAGRVLIRSHGKAHVDKILPSLEVGLTGQDYRIRIASLTLLGDLLSMIGGTSVVKGDGETQDDVRKAERAQAQIALALGAETRKRVLSRLYLARSDTTAAVRQSAVQVWKTVVSVTTRSLRDILRVLVGQIVDSLASGDPERTQVAGRCLGDIVNKLGDSVLPEIIPVLRNALYNGDGHTRRGVCVGLSEVISCSTKEQILRFIEIIVKVVQDALCDEDEGVREMAASCFQSLHNVVGNRALDEIVPSLLVALEHNDDEARARIRALNGLTGILSIRSRELLPYIIPRLVKDPITTNHAEALCGIAEVTGSTLHFHFQTIVPAIIGNLANIREDEGSERKEAVRACARAICHNIEEIGVNWLISEISSKCGSDKAETRCESCWMFQTLVEERKDRTDFYEQIPIILRELIYRLNDDNKAVLKANHAAFGALSKSVPAEELVRHIEFIRNLMSSMVSDARRRKGGVGDGEFLMPGFNMPKGLEPLLPIYQRGILYGTPSIREVSASGLGELISFTASKYLAGQLIIKMTGPLLRIVGDRNPPEVKIAILRTLGLVLVKGGPALRAFVPQFQTTFVKALADPSRQVRLEAISALAYLMPLSTRVDPLLKELVAGSLGRSSDNGGIAAVQTATLEALAVVLKKAGRKAKLPDSIPSALDASKDLLKHQDEGVREGAARVIGACCGLLGAETTIEVIEGEILDSTASSSGEMRHGKACACQRVMATMGNKIPESLSNKVTELVISFVKDDKPLVKEAACVALGAAVGSAPDPTSRLRQVEDLILSILKNSQELMEVHRAIATGLCLAIQLSTGTEDKLALLGKDLVDSCLKMAMSGSQRIQFSFNDVLYLVLDVAEGDTGLEAYLEMASFDNSKSMKSLYAKVLSRMKDVVIDV